MLTRDCFEIRILGRVLHADREEILRKIRAGAIVRTDQISIEDGAWTTFEQIPEFAQVFSEIENEQRDLAKEEFRKVFTNFQVKTVLPPNAAVEARLEKHCVIHPEIAPEFICTVCENLFCKPCIENWNQLMNCPYCGGHCILFMGQQWSQEIPRAVAQCETVGKPVEVVARTPIVQERLVWSDFVAASVYPFRFCGELGTGCVLFATLVFGLIATLFQGDWRLLLGVPIVSGVLVLKFGVLLRTYENFENDLPKRGFMPGINGFSVKESIIRPIGAGSATLVQSFGLFVLMTLIAISVAWGEFEDELAKIEGSAGKAESRLSTILKRGRPDVNSARQQAIDRRLRQLESVFGRNHLVENSQFEKLLVSVTRMTIWFQLPISLLFAFGLIFFPAGCIGAFAKSGSVRQRLVAGFTEMRRIGFDYMKILVMFIGLFLLSVAFAYGASCCFAIVEMPVAGTVASILLGSFVAFYFWVALSAILGITRNKRTVRINPCMGR